MRNPTWGLTRASLFLELAPCSGLALTVRLPGGLPGFLLGGGGRGSLAATSFVVISSSRGPSLAIIETLEADVGDLPAVVASEEWYKRPYFLRRGVSLETEESQPKFIKPVHTGKLQDIALLEGRRLSSPTVQAVKESSRVWLSASRLVRLSYRCHKGFRRKGEAAAVPPTRVGGKTRRVILHDVLRSSG
ncbi:hypothetical protein F2Q70_00023178 [Brassica cretica]|uniref:Chlorophyll a-b binding protein, chloroplastic n=1 Tax=Brassica cretica TaxID=69181 RepID=A0A8S9GU58_BRACR|nr:hypothetical protein F2Q70_00023178 [Brassica cretica]